MKVLPRNPVRRLVLGRLVTLTAAFTYCLLRAAAAFYPDPDRTPTGALLLSGNGNFLWVWGAAWLFAGGWCLVDLWQGHTRHGLPFAVGLAMAWGSAHAIVWVWSGFTNPDWIPALASITPCLIIFGLLLKVNALHEMVAQAAAAVRRHD
jgi:hypothetical protein